MQQDHRGVELEQSNSNKNEMKGVQQELLGQHKRKKRRIEKWAGMMEVMTQKKAFQWNHSSQTHNGAEDKSIGVLLFVHHGQRAHNQRVCGA